jgi:hypothetical protein
MRSSIDYLIVPFRVPHARPEMLRVTVALRSATGTPNDRSPLALAVLLTDVVYTDGRRRSTS